MRFNRKQSSSSFLKKKLCKKTCVKIVSKNIIVKNGVCPQKYSKKVKMFSKLSETSRLSTFDHDFHSFRKILGSAGTNTCQEEVPRSVFGC